MNIIVSLIIILVGLTSSSKACQHTATHSYIFSREESKLLVIDRKTGVEQIKEIEKGQHKFLIHKGFIYFLGVNPNRISVWNLETFSFVCKIDLRGGCYYWHIIDDLLYVEGLNSSHNSVIDTIKHQILRDAKWVPLPNSREISYNNLTYTPYLSLSSGGCVSVKDGEKEVKRIELEKAPNALVIHEGFLYVTFVTDTTLLVIDLQTQLIVKKIALEHTYADMEIHGKYGYVQDLFTSNLTVIDLNNQKIKEVINKPYKLMMDASDTHLYIGVTKFRKISPLLLFFKGPFTGIHCDLYGDGEQAFLSMEKAVKRGDVVAAKLYFEEALAACHPKAYSIVAYAYLQGKFGATIDLAVYNEFKSSMCQDYYDALTQGKITLD